MFGKSIVPEIKAKMLSANRIAVFLNERNIQNKLMKYPGFLHVGNNSKKLNND